MRGTGFWTDERMVKLKKLHRQEYSYTEMRDRLGVSRGAVSAKLKREGLAAQKRPYWQEQIVAALARAEPRASLRELSEATARPPGFVSAVLRRSKLARGRGSCSLDHSRVAHLRQLIAVQFCQ